MQHYFLKNNQFNDTTVTILGEDCFHIGKVMRFKSGEVIICHNENGEAFKCQLTFVAKDRVLADIIGPLNTNTELPCRLSLAQGLVKKDKLEMTLKYATQCGICSYQAVDCTRSVIHLKDIHNNKDERFKLIAKEAAEQSERTVIPTILSTVSFNEFLIESGAYDIKIVAYEEEGRKNNTSLHTLVNNVKNKSIIVFIGPEGGFSPEEISALKNNGFVCVGLGKRILRTEMACWSLLSVIGYECEWRGTCD